MLRFVESVSAIGEITEDVIVMRLHDDFPGQIQFTSPQNPSFVKSNSDYLSSFGVLNDTFMFNRFIEELESQSYEIYALNEISSAIDKINQLNEPLKVQGLNLPSFDGKEGGLFPYQQFGIRKALDWWNNSGKKTVFFFNHATGTGKSVLSMAMIQEAMMNRNQFDYTVVFTLKKNKVNFTRDINNFTTAVAYRNEGTKAKRDKEYFNPKYNVFVMNYEKANFDLVTLKKLFAGKRVLFICDEVQKVLSYSVGKNKSIEGLSQIVKATKESYIVPTTASGVNGNPQRYWRIFNLGRNNPLGGIQAYVERYGVIVQREKFGRIMNEIEWPAQGLLDIRHRVADQTHVVRKTDPGVIEFFKDTTFIPIPIQLSDEDRELYDFVDEISKIDTTIPQVQYFNAKRFICNSPEGFHYSDNKVGKALLEAGWELTSKHSSKLEVLLDKVEQIVEQGDKVVIFSQWTNITLRPIADALRGRRINFALHHGDMSEKEAQKAQDAFKSDSNVPVFLSSDAGSHGLSFPEAKYVISYEVPHSYDQLMQRFDRADRATSYHDGITFYLLYCEGTNEESVLRENNRRKNTNSITQGTTETLQRT